MNAKETLEKYGLKTDVKSIKERIFNIGDFGESSNAIYKAQLISANGFYSIKMLTECHTADLSLLCELAEKGERYEKAVKNRRTELQHIVDGQYYRSWAVMLASNINAELNRIIAEAEGEPR